MKKTNFVTIVFVILVLFSFFIMPQKVKALDDRCKNPNFYKVEFNIVPTEGSPMTEVQLEAKFKWTDLALPPCLEEDEFLFDFWYGAAQVIDKVSFGKATKEWSVHTFKVRPDSLPGMEGHTFRDGEILPFKMKVEYGNLARDLFSDPIVKNFKIKAGSIICAYIAGDGKYACIPGSEETTDCSTLSQCSGKQCVRIDSTKCGQLAKIYACVAGDGKYACSPGNKSDCSDAPACAGKSCSQIDKDKCGQNAGGGGGGGGRTETFPFVVPNWLKGGPETVLDLVKVIIDWLIKLAIPVAVIMILYGGVLYLTAGAYPNNVKKAKDVLWYTVIGLAIIFIGAGFITLIKSILMMGGGE